MHCDFLCISSLLTTRIQLSKKLEVAKTNAGGNQLLDCFHRLSRGFRFPSLRNLLNQKGVGVISAQQFAARRLEGRAPSWVGSLGDGGADRDRTDDPLLAKQMLSQLSYSPGSFGGIEN